MRIILTRRLARGYYWQLLFLIAVALSLGLALTSSFAQNPTPPANPTAQNQPIQPGGTLPVQEIEKIMQTKGTVVNEVLTITLDRKDLKVKGPDGHPFLPAFALDHEFYFQSLANGEAFMEAEFTFLPSERQATLKALMSNPLVLMAEHQHYIGESPQTFHYHFRGRGKATDLATWSMQVVRATKTPLPQPPPAHPPKTPLPVADLERIIGGKAQVEDDGVVSVMLPRPQTFVEAGVVLRPHMNIMQSIDFEPLNSRGTVAEVGADFALLGNEVDPALNQAFKEGFGIHCLYNQQTMIYPQLFFSHTLKSGEPKALAQSVRRILDAAKAAPPDPMHTMMATPQPGM